MATEYPEHEKLAEIAEHSQAIGEFLDWLQNEKGYTIAKWWEPDDDWLSDGELRSVRRSITDLLAEYYDIDQQALEGEKQDMLAKQRELNERN